MVLNSVGRKETMQDTQTNRVEETRQVAYKGWQEEGCPDGYDVQHWLKAETIWLEVHHPQGEPKEAKSLNIWKVKQTRSSGTREPKFPIFTHQSPPKCPSFH